MSNRVAATLDTKRCRSGLLGVLTCVTLSCAEMRPPTPPTGPGHLDAAAVHETKGEIPPIVAQSPYVPPPQPIADTERYTVVVHDVPVRELLFALARDAKLNVDIDNSVTGEVTLNAIDQSLTQILDRLARQISLRYEIDNGTVVVRPDVPYLRTYDVGYVNLSREVDTEVNVATRVATTGEGGLEDDNNRNTAADNNSSTVLNSRSYNRFWQTLSSNILAILGEVAEVDTDGRLPITDKVIVNAESGVITVKANSREHVLVQEFIDHVLRNARRQVLIEATIVEVTLSDQYQGGVDWRVILNSDKAGFKVDQNLLGAVSDGVIENALSSFIFGYRDPDLDGRLVDVTVRLLREFGDTRVLSSPRLMVLNNQTAVLKVVEELVYFTVEVTTTDSTLNAQGRTFVESEVHSVPVGLVMAVTPQISPNQEITLTVRPTISQKVGDAVDPGPRLSAQINNFDSDITNTVPIIRVREMESVLKLINGQIAVLGGLMQDEQRRGDREVPGLSRIPVLGDMFFDVEENANEKTELVVFLRPVVVTDPDVETDLEEYRRYLQIGSTASRP